MVRTIKLLLLTLFAVTFFTGCNPKTIDQLYCLPKKSEEYTNLQSVIDSAMTSMEYCAPTAGEHQQNVQCADLDGDGIGEYLVFARGPICRRRGSAARLSAVRCLRCCSP